VHPLDIEREADRRQRAAKGAQQLVVAAAAAQRNAVGGVVDLKQGPGVVAEAAHEAEVEDDPLRRRDRQQAVNLAHPAQRVVQRALQALEDLGAAAGVRQAQQEVGLVSGEVKRPDLSVHAHEIPGRELGEDEVAAGGVHPERVEQIGVQRRIAKAHAVVAQAGGVQRGTQDAEHLGRARRAGSANQLHAGLQELAALSSLGAHAPVGVGDVGEAQRRFGVGVTGGDDPGDGDGHVGAQHQHAAVLVEDAVGGPGATEVGARKRLLELEGGRVHLAVASVREHRTDPVGHGAQLPHLVGENVAGATGDSVHHRLEAAVAGRAKCAHAAIGASSSRVMRAPRSRSRSSIRS
jgi:hypothetical protein